MHKKNNANANAPNRHNVSVPNPTDPDPAHDELSHLMSASVQEYVRITGMGWVLSWGDRQC